MMQFEPSAEGRVSAHFELVEVGLLRLATSQLVELLEAADAHAPGTAADPALKRLLPDAYLDDPEAAAEFRRFTAGDLLDRKVLNAKVVLATLGEEPLDPISDEPDEALLHDLPDDAPLTIVLDPPDVQSWLRTLTDLRLTLAERLDIGPDGRPQREDEDAPFLRDVYEWFGMVQESLVYAIDV
ncbi:DUF2017 family protein [Cryobacterium sp. HLT2-28]|nr:DUF2017 family protein [Cryobacterium sp. HLT2-28]